MKFKLYKSYGALNSPPIFSAFEQGVKAAGHTVVENNEDVSVIWSVLWEGRMQPNQQIYQHCVSNGKPIIIIEVGNLKRGTTWRICLDHVNSLGEFGNNENLDPLRPQILGVSLKPEQQPRKNEILIACQHPRSLQWQGQPSIEEWVRNTIQRIRRYTTRRIVVRPHPRSQIREKFVDAFVELPRQLPNTYDDFDINYNYHCVINYNSGPAIQAAIHGVPVICDSSSLAAKISEKWENLETPQLPDRDEWFLKLTHTEWTVEEITQGIPLKRLEKHLEEKLKKIS
jgi:hypothetical protein